MKKEYFYGPVILLLVWYLVFASGIINPLFLPPPHLVIFDFFKLLTKLDVWRDISFTFLRTSIGFLLAACIGIPVGLCMGYYSTFRYSFEFLVDFFRSLPAISLFPLFLFFLGLGDAAKIATAVFTCALINIINSIYGVTSTKNTRKLVAILMEAKPIEIFFKVTLMEALPQVFVGLRTSLSYAIITIVATEMFVGNIGIGNRIYQAQLTFRVTEMFSFIGYAGILGYALNNGFVRIEKKLIHWSGQS